VCVCFLECWGFVYTFSHINIRQGDRVEETLLLSVGGWVCRCASVRFYVLQISDGILCKESV
jgi:hypothetical protein